MIYKMKLSWNSSKCISNWKGVEPRIALIITAGKDCVDITTEEGLLTLEFSAILLIMELSGLGDERMRMFAWMTLNN